MNAIHELAEYLKKFPGVGPRQATRFVYFLLKQDRTYLKQVARLISELKNSVSTCKKCFRFFQARHGEAECSVCSGKNRDENYLLIVSNETDLDAIEKSGSYNGKYFVLGGTVPILAKNYSERIRLNELIKTVKENSGLTEIVLALNANPEGEHTADIVRDSLKKMTDERKIKISLLGRGLSTGAEIEYSDSETLKNALRNRF